MLKTPHGTFVLVDGGPANSPWGGGDDGGSTGEDGEDVTTGPDTGGWSGGAGSAGAGAGGSTGEDGEDVTTGADTGGWSDGADVGGWCGEGACAASGPTSALRPICRSRLSNPRPFCSCRESLLRPSLAGFAITDLPSDPHSKECCHRD